MKKGLGVVSIGALTGVIVFTLAVAYRPTGDPGTTAAAQQRGCPYATPMDQVQMEIVEIFFTRKVAGVDGNHMEISDEKADQFRLGVVTIKVTKPAGMTLSIAAADLTLHYYHGNNTECAPCEGLSSFSSILEVDRPIKLPRMDGPGFTKQTTGVRSSGASVVYLDAVFGYLEPSISECWLCVGQPSTMGPFLSEGWNP